MTLTSQLMQDLWVSIGELRWIPNVRSPLVRRSPFPAKRHRSPLHDLRHAETQRRTAALRHGAMRTAGHVKVPLLALLVPSGHLDAFETLSAYCLDNNIRVEYIPWDHHHIIVCRNAADQMTLKIMFPYLC